MRLRRGPVWIMFCLAALSSLTLGLAEAVVQPTEAQAGCINLIVNGDFENNSGWVSGASAVPPQYVATQYHSPQRSLLLGIPTGYPNQQTYSSVRQSVTLPPGTSSATLTFWYYAIMPGAPTTDYVELALLAPDGHALLDKPWRAFVDNRAWNQATFDISNWRGQSVQVYFNVYNDGAGQNASMFLDDVSLVTCGGGTALVPPTVTASPTLLPGPPTVTPTLLPTLAPAASATPVATWTPSILPTAPVSAPAAFTPGVPPGPAPVVTAPDPSCVDLVQNGNFAQGLEGWITAPNRIPVELMGVPGSNSQVLRLGTMETNLNSYSSIRQPLILPHGYAQLQLDFSTWTWAEAPGGSDHQEADFLAPDPTVLEKFWRPLSNDQAWIRHVIPVNKYAGQNVVLYFNVYNDGAGGRAAMFLDEVHVWACLPYAEAMPPAVPSLPLLPTQMSPLPTAPLLSRQVLIAPLLSGRAPTAPPLSGQAAARGLAGAGATVSPAETVLSLYPSPTPTPAPPTATRIVEVARQPSPTPAPVPGLLERLPQGWPLGLLAIIVILLLLVLVLRAQQP